MEFFSQMEPMLRTYWFIALPVSAIFIIQTVMTFAGTDAMDGTSPDFDGDASGGDAPFQLFSLRNLINFLLGLSWSGIAFYQTITNASVLVAVSVIVGGLFVYLFFLIIQQVQKLAEDNSFRIADTVNQTAEVYLTVPAAMAGKGKVLVSVRGSVHELEAITQGEQLPTGSIVTVERVENNNLLVVGKR